MLKKLQYHFENGITKSSNFVLFMLVLAALTAALMVLFEIALGVSSQDHFGDHWWTSLSEIIDIGSGDNYQERILDILYWALGVAISGSIIAFLTAKVAGVVAKLNTGRSFIIDEDHYVIVGWNTTVFKIFSEIALANENQSKPTIVCINGMKNSEIRSKIDLEYPDQRGIRILTRSGNIGLESELAIVNPKYARSIIVLDDVVDSKFNTETTILSLRKLTDGKDIPIVAQFNSTENIKVLSSLSGSPILPVNKDGIIATITSQAIRNQFVTEVVMDFLDFDGDEIYFFPSSRVQGKSYKQAMVELGNVSLIGIREASGVVCINPNKNRLIQADDELIVIAADDDFNFEAFDHDSMEKALNQVVDSEVQLRLKERSDLLVLGWSKVGQQIMDNLLPFLHEDSSIKVFYRDSLVSDAPDFSNAPSSMKTEIQRLESNSTEGFVDHIQQNEVSTSLILGYNDRLDDADADTLSLMQTLHLKNAARESEQNEAMRVILQLNDGSKKSLVAEQDRSEFIVSDELSSLLMTQLAENPPLSQVFDELFSNEGAKINVVPFKVYQDHQKSFDQINTYWQLVVACLNLDHTCVGFIQGGELKLNPKKDCPIALSEDLQVVVIH